MIPTKPDVRPPGKIHGGKYYLKDWLLRRFPAHDVYLSLFGGMANDLLNKPRAIVDIYNDLDPWHANLMRVLCSRPEKLRELIQRTDYTEDNFTRALAKIEEFKDKTEKIEYPRFEMANAWATIVASRFSRGGMCRSFAFSGRTRGGLPGDVNSWKTFQTVHFDRVVARMFDVGVWNKDAIKALVQIVEMKKNAQGGRVLVYADPPYLQESRSAKWVYRTEFRQDEEKVSDYERHVELLSNLIAAGSHGIYVAISAYRSELYDHVLKDWNRFELEVSNHSGQGQEKQKRVECLYCNYGLDLLPDL